MKPNRTPWLPLGLICCLASTASLSAHHGAAAYDTNRVTEMSATVTSLDWRNPHALIHFDAVDSGGNVVPWTAETAGLVILIRAGWTREVLKPGDRVTIFGHRAVNGSHTMLLRRLVFPTGRELNSLVPSR